VSIAFSLKTSKEALLRPITKAWRYIRLGPSHLTMYVFGRFSGVRSIMLRLHRGRAATMAQVAPALETSALERVDVEHAANAIRKDGYFSGLRLLPDMLENLRRFSATSTCLAEGDSQYPFIVGERLRAEKSYRRKIRTGYLDDSMRECPEVHTLAFDATIIAVAGKYLGCHPVFLGARIWWSFPTDADASEQILLGQGFHYDLDGYAAVAFFFYLTDVDPATGPHVLVRGSHVKKPWKGLVSLYKGRPDAEIEKWYGKDNQVMLCGSAGSGFAEDLFCYHKGTHPQRGERLMLQLRYGIRRYYDPWATHTARVIRR
jgi:hypothetical protein